MVSHVVVSCTQPCCFAVTGLDSSKNSYCCPSWQQWSSHVHIAPEYCIQNSWRVHDRNGLVHVVRRWLKLWQMPICSTRSITANDACKPTQVGCDDFRRRGQGHGQGIRGIVVNWMMSKAPDIHFISICLRFFVSLISVLLSVSFPIFLSLFFFSFLPFSPSPKDFPEYKFSSLGMTCLNSYSKKSYSLSLSIS